jgi:hypothetical protein
MNLKKAKALRRMLRAEGFDWRDAKYQMIPHERSVWVPGTGRVLLQSFSVRLHLQSGKGLYRAVKQEAANG